MTLPGRADVSTALIHETLNHLDYESVNAMHYRNVKGNSQELFKDMGFIEPPKSIDMFMLLYYMNPSLYDTIAVSKPEQLYFTYGDYL